MASSLSCARFHILLQNTLVFELHNRWRVSGMGFESNKRQDLFWIGRLIHFSYRTHLPFDSQLQHCPLGYLCFSFSF
jgi:hypothetical protein